MSSVIFSIDKSWDSIEVHKFLTHLSNLAVNVKTVVGSYRGTKEVSFVMDYEDFYNVVAFTGAVDQQESILEVTNCNKQYATLVFNDGRREGLGSLKEVSREEAEKHDSWTHDVKYDRWFITVRDNPDGECRDTVKRKKQMRVLARAIGRLNLAGYETLGDALEEQFEQELKLYGPS